MPEAKKLNPETTVLPVFKRGENEIIAYRFHFRGDEPDTTLTVKELDKLNKLREMVENIEIKKRKKSRRGD